VFFLYLSFIIIFFNTFSYVQHVIRPSSYNQWSCKPVCLIGWIQRKHHTTQYKPSSTC